MRHDAGPSPEQRGDPRERVLTVAEACLVLRLSRSALYGLMTTGAIAYLHFGRCRRIEVAEIERYIAACRRGGTR
jgi:excisionase family DNA binding protein